MNHPRIILSLFDFSGVWSQPYVDAGFTVVRVDLQHEEGEHQLRENLWHVGADVRDWNPSFKPYGVLAAPDCACFCRPAARWWKRQDAEGKTRKAVAALRRALMICEMAEGWWALENPPGRHKKLLPRLGDHSWQFQPFHYGDAWNKQTYIWGTANKPAPTNIVEPPPTVRTPNGRSQGTIARMSSSWKRQREMTPPGFAKAFFECNQ